MILKRQAHYVELECEMYQAREVLRALLHSIVFHRYLEGGRVQDVDLDVCRVTFSKVVHEGVEERIEAAVQSANRYLEDSDDKCIEVKILLGPNTTTSGGNAGTGGNWLTWQKSNPSGAAGEEGMWEEWKVNLKIQANSQLGK